MKRYRNSICPIIKTIALALSFLITINSYSQTIAGKDTGYVKIVRNGDWGEVPTPIVLFVTGSDYDTTKEVGDVHFIISASEFKSLKKKIKEASGLLKKSGALFLELGEGNSRELGSYEFWYAHKRKDAESLFKGLLQCLAKNKKLSIIELFFKDLLSEITKAGEWAG
jgi:hypothetical protein